LQANDLPLRLGWLLDNTLLNVGFDVAKDFLVSLHRYMQSVQKTLGRVKVQDDSLVDVDGLIARAHWLGVQTEVNNQLFGRAGDAAKIRVRANGAVVGDRNGTGSFLLWLLFFSHDYLNTVFWWGKFGILNYAPLTSLIWNARGVSFILNLRQALSCKTDDTISTYNSPSRPIALWESPHHPQSNAKCPASHGLSFVLWINLVAHSVETDP